MGSSVTGFFQHYIFKAHPYCGMYQNFIPFYYPIIFHYMTVPHFIDEDLGGFHFLAIKENTPVNISVYAFVQTFISISLGCILRSGVAGS